MLTKFPDCTYFSLIIFHLQIKRHKISCSSMGSSNFNPETTTASSRDRLSTPPFSGPVPTSKKVTHRRKSIAVMEHRHLMASGCLQLRTEDPELARSDRSRKQSWSVVVGEADCRSVDTGLNELDRLIGACVCKCGVCFV